ncbi:MAG: hypothetical protein H6746_10235 [Deltaproteobacteria bacterium]|nr:hypothetical protein [Deltaproteobacteria bacterium]
MSSEFVVFRREGERAVTSAGVWRHVNEGWGPESPLAYSSALGFAPERGAVIGRVTPSLLEVPDTVREGMTWTSGPHRFEVVRRTFEVTAAGTLPVWEIERGERADTPGAYAFRPGSSFWAEGVGPLTAPDAVDSRDLIGAFVPLEDAPDQQPDAPTLAMEPMAITGTDAKSWVGAEPEVGWAWSRGGQTVLYLRIRGWTGGFGQTVLRRSWSCWRFTAGDTRTAAVEEPKMESADLDSPSTTDINCYGIFRGPNEGTLEMPWKPAWNTRGVWIDADAIRMPSPAPNHAQAGVSVTKTVHPEFTFVGGGPGAIPAGLTHGELMYRLQGGGDYANHMPQLPALGHFRGLSGLTSARHLQTPRHPLALEFAGGLVAEAWLDADGTVGELAPVAQLGGAQTWLAREGANDLLMVDAQGRVDELVVDGDGVRVERLGVLDLPEGVEARLAFRIDEQVLGVVTFEVTEEDPVGSEPDTRKTGFWRVALGAPESPRPQVKPAPALMVSATNAGSDLLVCWQPTEPRTAIEPGGWELGGAPALAVIPRGDSCALIVRDATLARDPYLMGGNTAVGPVPGVGRMLITVPRELVELPMPSASSDAEEALHAAAPIGMLFDSYGLPLRGTVETQTKELRTTYDARGDLWVIEVPEPATGMVAVKRLTGGNPVAVTVPGDKDQGFYGLVEGGGVILSPQGTTLAIKSDGTIVELHPWNFTLVLFADGTQCGSGPNGLRCADPAGVVRDLGGYAPTKVELIGDRIVINRWREGSGGVQEGTEYFDPKTDTFMPLPQILFDYVRGPGGELFARQGDLSVPGTLKALVQVARDGVVPFDDGDPIYQAEFARPIDQLLVLEDAYLLRRGTDYTRVLR